MGSRTKFSPGDSLHRQDKAHVPGHYYLAWSCRALQGTDHPSIGLWTGRPLSNRLAQASSPMRHPFQTDTFDPGDPELHKRVWAGQKAHEGFHIGSTAYLVDGVRWIHLHGAYPYPCPYTFAPSFFRGLAYPLPEPYGEDHHLAMNAFESHWHAERKRLWALEPPPVQVEAAPQPSEPSAPVPRPPQPQRPPNRASRDRLVLAGAVPLPGLEPWTGFGLRG
jgi:hypothetical protein